MGDNRRFMSQRRSEAGIIAGSLFAGLLAYAGGLAAMMWTQGRLVGHHDIRLVLIGAEIALALPALVLAAILASRIPDLYRFRPLPAWGVLTTVGLGLTLWALSLGVFEAQYVLVRPPAEYLKQFQGLHDSLKPVGLFGWIFSVTAIAITPALCEEILFRGLLTPVLRRALGPLVAILVSAVLFGAIHVDAMADGTSVYYRVPFAFFLGMLLAKIRLDTQSLWPSMIAHATLNATTFVVVLFSEEPVDTLPDPQPLLALGMLLVGGVFSWYLLRRLRAAEPALSA